jgi:hypothetical protein
MVALKVLDFDDDNGELLTLESQREVAQNVRQDKMKVEFQELSLVIEFMLRYIFNRTSRC